MLLDPFSVEERAAVRVEVGQTPLVRRETDACMSIFNAFVLELDLALGRGPDDISPFVEVEVFSLEASFEDRQPAAERPFPRRSHRFQFDFCLTQFQILEVSLANRAEEGF